jgi:hypothetical protein
LKRPPEERARLLRLLRVTAVGAVLIVAVGALAVVGGVFDPDDEERARSWLEREYDAEVGPCDELRGERVVCDLDRVSPALSQRLGPLVPDTEPRVCLFVLDNASVVVDRWASGAADEPCGPDSR